MIKAIIYESKTGHTEQYAQLLSKNLNLPCYTIKQAEKELPKNDQVIFLSWIFAGKLSKLSTVRKKYTIFCCGGVGMTPYSEKYIQELKAANNVSELFYLPGGISLNKLTGIKKKMIQMVIKSLEQENKSENKEFIKSFKENTNLVSESYLKSMLQYVQRGEKND